MKNQFILLSCLLFSSLNLVGMENNEKNLTPSEIFALACKKANTHQRSINNKHVGNVTISYKEINGTELVEKIIIGDQEITDTDVIQEFINTGSFNKKS